MSEHHIHHHVHRHDERKHRASGGVNMAEEDLKDKPEARTNAKNIDSEAEERKHGGKAKHHRKERKLGGGVKHHHVDGDGKLLHKKVKGKSMHHHEGRAHGGKAPEHHAKKHVGHMEGEHAMHHAGRKPRKAGGRTGSDEHPFSSARKGTHPEGHTYQTEAE